MLEEGKGMFGYFRSIGDIGEAIGLVGQDWHRPVHNGERFYLDIIYGEGEPGQDGVETKIGQTFIGAAGKKIWTSTMKLVDDIGRRVDVESVFVGERPQVVQTTHMVVVYVGEEQGIYMIDSRAQELRAEVRSAVNKNISAVLGVEGRRAHTIVARVGRTAHRAMAQHDGYTVRCACAKERDVFI